MVNTHLPDAVHVDQLGERKRKSPPRDDSDGCDPDRLRGVRASPSSRRRLSIDVTAAATATSRCYREDARSSVSSACSSPSSSSSSSSPSSRPSKCMRLSGLSSPTSPISLAERLKHKQRRKELASRRRFFRLYNKRIASPDVVYAFRFPLAGPSYNAPAHSPVHTLGHPASLSFDSPFPPSSTSPPPSPFSPGTPFFQASSPSILRTAPAGSDSSRGCLHQSCAAFRFASMIDGVHLSSLSSPRALSNQNERAGSFYIPPILPPINRYTLQELDPEAIMKNPQLRHDLLFDVGLQFRPTDSKRKRETADMYWCTVKSELEAGCSCVSFDDLRHMHRHACHCPTNIRNAGRNARDASEYLPCEDSLPISVPSRIGSLIEELREIIIAVVIPPPPPVPIRSGTLGTHSPYHVLCPRRLVAEEASVAWLHEAFDVPLVQQQLRHGLFNPRKLLVAVSELLREHCAPARDSMVDAMMLIAEKCEPGTEGRLIDALAAIRMCFELIEFMRLDLANHLLAHLRPHLLASAPQFEGALFERRLDPNVPVTRAWISSSYLKFSSSPNLRNAVGGILPLPERMGSLSSIQKIVATVLPALVDLVVFPPNPTSASLPPSPTTTPVTKGQQTYQVSVQPGYPEILYLDHSRLLMFTADAADITASAMFLAMFRQFVFSSPSKDGECMSVSDDDLMQLKREIAAVGPPRPGVCFCKGYSLNNDFGAESENPKLYPWRNAMSNVALHIAHTIENVRVGKARLSGTDTVATEEGLGSATDSASRLFTPPNAELVESVTSWCITHMRADSVVSLVFRKKVVAAVLKVLIPRFFALWNAGVQQRFGHWPNLFTMETSRESEERKEDARRTKTGLEPLSEEIALLAERLAKLAVLHLRVYFPFYERSEVLPA